MKFITKLGVTCATIAMMASTISYAGTVAPDDALLDTYIGADGNTISTTDSKGGDNYDIQWMQVSRIINGSSGSLSVTIHSDFVKYNDKTNLKFGDLFMMNADADSGNYQQADECTVNGSTAYGCNEYTEKENSWNSANNVKISPNKWQYAFDLGSTGRHSNRNNSYNTYKGGDVRKIDQSKYNDQIRSTTSNRDWHGIYVSDEAKDIGNGRWGTDVSNNLLTMTFDISNTSLMGAAQIALRWQMSCANDIIEVVKDFGPTTSVPEPSTIVLMLLAGLGLVASRRNKATGFKA